MASLASIDTLDTQTVWKLKRVLEGRSASHPHPQLDAGQGQPQNVMYRESPPRVEPEESTKALPIAFTLATQTSPQSTIHSRNEASLNVIPNKSPRTDPVAEDARLRTNKMHYSFVDFALDTAGGDTQPMTTQEFRDYSDLGSSRIGFDANTGAIGGGLMVTDNEALARTVHNVDLTRFGDGKIEEEEEDDVSSLNRTDEPSPVALARIQATTAALFKIPQPKTPGTTNRKRNWQDMMSSEHRTSSTKGPGSAFRALLGNTGGPLHMTQLFMNTQLGSSPPPGAPHSDGVFERPSPTAFMRPSSPRGLTISSPIRPSTSDGVGKEPFNIYRPMEDSQKSRIGRLRMEEEERVQARLEEDEIDNSWTERFRQKVIRQRQRSAFVGDIQLSAPERSSKSRRSKSFDYLSSERQLQTPATKFAEFQQVTPGIRSDGIDQSDLPDTLLEQDMDDLAAGVQVPMTSSKQPRKSQPGMSQQPSLSSSQHSESAHVPTQMTVAVQDSQGEHHVKDVSIGSAALLAAPSSAISGNRIVQSQYGESRSGLRVIPTQELRDQLTQLADVDDADAPAEHDRYDAIPSSPPLEFSEHDHEYDGNSDNDPVEMDNEVITTHTEDEQEETECDGAKVEEELGAVGTQANVEPNAVKITTDLHLHSGQLSLAQYVSQIDTEQMAPQLTVDLRRTSHALDNPLDMEASRENQAEISAEADLYETAASHQTPVSSARIQQIRQSDEGSQGSPIKRVKDIANVPSFHRSSESFQSQEIDSLVDNIFTEGDKEFMKVTLGASPRRPAKRVRTYSSKRSILREPSLNANLTKAPKTAKINVAADATSPKPTSTSRPSVNQEQQAARPVLSPPVVGPDTPASVRERELEGANAAIAAKKTTGSRKVAQPVKRKTKGRQTPRARRKASKSMAKNPSEHVNDVEDDFRLSTPLPQNQTTDQNRLITSPLTSSGIPQLVPPARPADAESTPSAHKILALFKGNSLYYYPATYLETVFSDGEKYRVKFYDGTVAVVDPTQVRQFDLRIDDCVKVDLNGMRKGTYLVQAFEEVTGVSYTDLGGHNGVRLVPKTAEGSVTTLSPVTVPVERVYLTGNMLPTFADRKFMVPLKGANRFATPTLQVSEPTSPSSRSRRPHLATSVHGIDQSTTSDSGLFSNMLFAVTFINVQSQQKDSIARQITGNGGSLMEDGFDGIFEPEAVEICSPRKSPSRLIVNSDATKEPLRLKLGAQCLGFTAVIADRHCRKEKYLQALALGIPCLHHRWITDCIDQSAILSFERYLLPAGESEFLSGAVHSRILAPYSPRGDEATLRRVLEKRPRPLRDATILLAIPSVERRHSYQFLAYAAGASSVKCAHNLGEAKKLLADGLNFDWIICDGDKAKARDTLLAPSKQDVGKRKRKRDSDVPPSTPRQSIRVSDSEFLVQSLILGALADL